MDVDHYKTILEQKEREMTEELARRRNDALEARKTDVGDEMDSVTDATEEEEALLEGELASDTLTMVQDALKRIQDGTYGICIDCGEQITPARLEAVPWTPYCLKDQEKHDKEAARNHEQTLSDIA